MRPHSPEPRVHRAGTFNLRKGRNRDVVAREVDDFLTDHDLDWLVVQEAAGYVRTLGKRLRGRYAVHTGWTSVSRRDSAVIVRVGVGARFKRVHRLERKGWERAPENRHLGLHNPRSAVSVQVGKRGWRYRVVSVHIPPGPHTEQWPLRKRAAEQSFATLRRLARRWARFAMVGDWNVRLSDETMRRFLADTNAEAIGSGIDYPVTSGVVANDYRLVRFGNSDHQPRVFTVRPS